MLCCCAGESCIRSALEQLGVWDERVAFELQQVRFLQAGDCHKGDTVICQKHAMQTHSC